MISQGCNIITSDILLLQLMIMLAKLADVFHVKRAYSIHDHALCRHAVNCHILIRTALFSIWQQRVSRLVKLVNP